MLLQSGQLSADMLVIGGGIMGLWAAVSAAREGLDVCLVERQQIGAGASGGLLGALFPWMPDRWDAKKQYQLDALVSLPFMLGALEAETGLSAGWARVGRIIPLPKAHLVRIAERHSKDALSNWVAGGERFAWNVLSMPPVQGYIADQFGEGGYVHDTLASRVSPRKLVKLLRAWLEARPNVRLIEGVALASIDERGAVATFVDGTRMSFSHVVLAAGVDSFSFLERHLPPLPKPLGQGVKGQAALMKAEIDPTWPVAFLDGLYVVPHEGGFVAVGSTSENLYADPLSTDDLLEEVICRARALVPALKNAVVTERWAGIRPKAVSRDPLAGPVSPGSRIVALTGGFKISFGVAHHLAGAAIDLALGRKRPDLPENFTVAGQLKKEFGISAPNA